MNVELIAFRTLLYAGLAFLLMSCSHTSEEKPLSDWVIYLSYFSNNTEPESVSGLSVTMFETADSIYCIGRSDIGLSNLEDSPARGNINSLGGSHIDTIVIPRSLEIGDYYLGRYDKQIDRYDTMELIQKESYIVDNKTFYTYLFDHRNPPIDGHYRKLFSPKLGFIRSYDFLGC